MRKISLAVGMTLAVLTGALGVAVTSACATDVTIGVGSDGNVGVRLGGTDCLERQVVIMQSWADFATGTSNVVALPVKAVA